MPTRREVLTGAGAAALGGTVLTGTAAADHRDAQPTHVTLTYDEATLERYQPLLQIPPKERAKLIGLYGAVASSPEYETNVACYWCSYTHQEASGLVGNRDAHRGDHEPLHVEYDPETGSVQRVRASIYHWLKGSVEPTDVELGGGTETNYRARVISPWHQYTAAAPDAAAERFPVRDLLEQWEAWLENGLEKSVEPGAGLYNPWVMRTRSSWWRDSAVGGFSTDAAILRVYRTLGVDTAGSLEAE